MDHLVLHLTKHNIENVPETMVRKKSKQNVWFITFRPEVIYIICD